MVEPMKKLTAEFGAIAIALKKRDATLSECLKTQTKLEKLSKLEKTGNNLAKIDSAKKAYLLSKEDFDNQNRLLLLELPQFYEKRVDYFQPCLQVKFYFINSLTSQLCGWGTKLILGENNECRFRLGFFCET